MLVTDCSVFPFASGPIEGGDVIGARRTIGGSEGALDVSPIGFTLGAMDCSMPAETVSGDVFAADTGCAISISGAVRTVAGSKGLFGVGCTGSALLAANGASAGDCTSAAAPGWAISIAGTSFWLVEMSLALLNPMGAEAS